MIINLLINAKFMILSTYLTKSHLQQHFIVNHEGNKPFQCWNCNANFAQSDSDVDAAHDGPIYALTNDTFKRHIKIVHERQILFNCEICEGRLKEA